ncbi:signal peptidase II [Candidatus Pelagibacter sp.]|jgi:signal peptidase II|nr:signal peptidase II [Candidatus Pelagibacter sp.]MDB3942361.1 signal peptidase II [Candidatus Pelagibacter sp.]
MGNNILKKNIFYFFFILFIFILDRVTKLWIISIFNSENNLEIKISSFINLHLIWNKGIAFGLFSYGEKFEYNLLTGLIIMIISIVFWMTIKTKGLEKYGFLMILGGALGNIFDRLYYSAVPDFIDIYYKNFHWFVFNVADIFITVGVLMLIINEITIKNPK